MEWHLCCPDVQLKRPRNYLAEKQTSIQLYSKLMSIQYMVLDSNPQPSEREFSTITIRPGLPPN